jgi:hypothetical protein
MMILIGVFLLSLFRSGYSLQAPKGWTYVATDSTCAGTTSNPCGPVSSYVQLTINNTTKLTSVIHRNIGTKPLVMSFVQGQLSLPSILDKLSSIHPYQSPLFSKEKDAVHGSNSLTTTPLKLPLLRMENLFVLTLI